MFRARLMSRAGLLIGILCAVAVSVLLILGLAAGARLASDAAVVGALPDESTPAGWVQIQTRPSADPDAQVAAADELFDATFGSAATVERIPVGEPGTDFERLAWRITPEPTATAAEDLAALTAGLSSIDDRFRDSEAASGGALVTGNLLESVREISAATAATQALVPIPIAIFAVLAWFAILQLARLLGASRASEVTLARARGAVQQQILTLTLIEAAGVVMLGALCGVLLATAALAVIFGSGGAAAVGGLWPVAVAAALAAFLTVGIGEMTGTATASSRAVRAGRAATTITPILAALLVLLSALLIWQSARATDPDDPWSRAVTVLAPTVAVAALALVASVLFAPAATVSARLIGLRGGHRAVTAVRQVARQSTAFVVPVVLIAVTVAGALLASSYAATFARGQAVSEQLSAGAGARVVLPTVTASDIALAGEVAPAAPVYAATVVAGEEVATLSALATDAIAAVITPVAGYVDPQALSHALTGETNAIPLPEGSTALTVTAAVSASIVTDAGYAQLRAWLVDRNGSVQFLNLTVTSDDDTLTGRADLPSGEGWAVLGVEALQNPSLPVMGIGLAPESVVAVAGDRTEPLAFPTSTDLTLGDDGSGDTPVSSGLLWSAAAAVERVPVVITTALATPLGLSEGDPIDLAVEGSGREFAATVVGIQPALPRSGTGPGVLTSLPRLVEASAAQPADAARTSTPPTANEIWVRTDDAGALAERFDAPVITAGSAGDAVSNELATVWVAASLGGAVLAGVALVAVFGAIARRRAGDVLILRALGVAPPEQTRIRMIELGVVAIVATVIGGLGGWVLARLLVPGLVQRAIPGLDATPALAIAPLPLAVTAVILVVSTLVISAVTAVLIRRAATSSRREEVAG